ncbi:MAG: YbhB/YbcL family Raf kinase inhibitor-like protein [Burkholderiaceae bacterium]
MREDSKAQARWRRARRLPYTAMLENLPDFVGHALRDQRAGLDQLAFNRLPLRAGQGAITVGSLAFVDHAPLPMRYTADGDGLSPPLHWTGVPDSATSVVLIVEDADSPTPHPLVHAIAVALPSDDGSLRQGALDDDADAPEEARLGRNSYLGHGWLPPDPPPGHGPHRYAFQVFALAGEAALPETPGRDALMAALARDAIASGMIIGTYERHDTTVNASEAAPALA